MRLFFASWPPPAVAKALAQWAREAQRACGGRITREDTIHLTLAFLGEADPQAALAAGRAVRGRATSLTVDIARYWNHNRIVWVGPANVPPELAELARALGETREFAGHVTLLRKARPPAQLPPLPPLEWPVTEFLLVNSNLGPEGPSYEVLERVALG
jgi:RNA 2',3'-cyclic 3'-phosphodiesterase